MSILSVFVCITDQFCNLIAIRNRNLGNLGIFLCKDRHISVFEVLYRFFSYRKNGYVVASFFLSFHELEKIGVIAACKTSVSGNDYIEPFVIFTALGKRRSEIRVAVCYIRQCLKCGLEIRLGLIRFFFCLTKFGCCNKLHCLRDLHSALNALYSEFNSFHISSHL